VVYFILTQYVVSCGCDVFSFFINLSHIRKEAVLVVLVTLVDLGQKIIYSTLYDAYRRLLMHSTSLYQAHSTVLVLQCVCVVW